MIRVQQTKFNAFYYVNECNGIDVKTKYACWNMKKKVEKSTVIKDILNKSLKQKSEKETKDYAVEVCLPCNTMCSGRVIFPDSLVAPVDKVHVVYPFSDG